MIALGIILLMLGIPVFIANTKKCNDKQEEQSQLTEKSRKIVQVFCILLIAFGIWLMFRSAYSIQHYHSSYSDRKIEKTASATVEQQASPPQKTESTTNIRQDSQRIAEAIAKLDGHDVYLNVQTDYKNESLQVSVKTNLPEETELSVHLYGPNGYNQGNSKMTVNAENEAFLQKANYKPLGNGRYKIEVVMPLPQFQSEYVKQVIGDTGQRLHGLLVEKDNWKIVEFEKKIKITGSNVIAQAEQEQQSNALKNQLKQEFQELYTQLKNFKNKADFHSFGFSISSPYNKWLKAVNTAANKYPGRLQVGFLNFGYLRQMGMEYMRNQGRETEFTQQMKKEFTKQGIK